MNKIRLLMVMLGAATLSQALIAAEPNRYANAGYAGPEGTVALVLKADTNAVEAQSLFGQLFARHDDFETVVELLEEAAEADDAVALTHLRFAQASCQLANHPDTGMLSKPGLASDCRASFEQASRLDPKLLPAWQGLFDYYRMAPAIAGGDVDKARAIIGKIAALDPAEAELAMATLAAMDEQIDQMRSHFAKAAELKPTEAESYRFREALALMRFNQFEPAYAVLQSLQASSEPAMATQVQYQLGRIAVLASKADWYADAERHLQAYLARTDLTSDMPAKSWAAFRLGQVYELMGKAELSRQQYLWAAGQQPDEPLKAELKKKGIKA